MKRLTFLILFILISGNLSAQKTRYVVIAMLDGARYTETFGDSSHSNIPAMWNVLRPQGTIYTSYYNNGKTETNPGHASILSGTWQYIANDGSEHSRNPTIFEYFRKQKNLPAAVCWVALGKAKLDVLANSTHPDYGMPYAASVRTSADPENDLLTSENIGFVLTNHRSRITIANFAKIDIDGHAASWEKYIASIKRADTLMVSLWNSIQADPELKNKTTLIITNDHGRHTIDFTGHGDGCDGCRHIMLMILGPDTPKNVVDSTIYSQIDIATTVGKMMRFATPLSQGKVIQSAIDAAINVPLTLKSPPSGKISGTVNIQWSVGTSKDTLSTLLEYTRNAGATWDTLFYTTSKDSLFLWNTLNVVDGTRYQLRIQVFGDTSYGLTSTSNFTIDNPGNGAPDVSLLSPNRNLILSGMQEIQWSAEDPEGDILTISIYGSSNSGTSWQLIVSDLANTGSYQWNTALSANSTMFKLKIVCSDGTAAIEGISPMFEVSNSRQKIQFIQQIAGTGSGKVAVNIIDQLNLTGNTYRVSFSVIDSAKKTVSVQNVTTTSAVMNNIPFAGDGGEGPIFDGVRLGIVDYVEPTHDPESTKWIQGNSTLFSKVTLPEIIFPDRTIQATPEAADYEIRISDSIVDTSMGYLESTPTPMYFTVFNISKNRKTPIVLSELIPNGKLTFGDDLFLFKKDSAGNDALTWEIFIDGETTSVEPKPGDIYRIATHKPITAQDVFEFTAIATSVGNSINNPVRFSLSQNYPNPFNPVTTIDYAFPTESIVTIQIFDLLGREVATIFKERLATGQYSTAWNATTFATGVYFYRLTAVPLNKTQAHFMQVKKLVLMK